MRIDDMERLMVTQREVARQIAQAAQGMDPAAPYAADLTDAVARSDRAAKKLERVVYTLKIARVAERITADQAEKARLETELATK